MASNLDNLGLGTPASEARDIHAKWRDSAESLIAACSRIAEVMTIYGDGEHNDDRGKFVNELIERGLLSRHDGKLQNKSSKLSKLITIGESACLQDRRVRPLLPPSYSTLYYICQLSQQYEKLDAKSATAKLISVLERYKGRLDARAAVRELNRVKRHKRRNPRQAKSQPTSMVELLARSRQYDMLLITPNPRELDLLAAGHGVDYLARCLPLSELVAGGKSQAIVALALDAQHIELAPLILGLSGRHTFPQEASNRSGLRQSESTILLTSDGISPHSKTADWPALKIGFQRLLEESYPTLRRRLHVFASSERPGWRALIGDNSWSQVPVPS